MYGLTGLCHHHPPSKANSKIGHSGRKCGTTPAPTPSGSPAIYSNQRCREGVLVNDTSTANPGRERHLASVVEHEARELATQSPEECCTLVSQLILALMM